MAGRTGDATGGRAHVVVIGGGIAGVSAAAALATHPSTPRVVLVEAEDGLARHTTGRSAAQLIENYGTPATRGLTRASRAWFRRPPEGVVDHSLLRPRGLLTVAGPGREAAFDQLRSEGAAVDQEIVEISAAEAAVLFPPLRTGLVVAALHEPGSADIDVAGLQQSFVRSARAAGAELRTDHRVTALTADGSGWRITTTGGSLGADTVVNAAGAWGDRVADLAGVAPLGLRPLRRTAFMVPCSHPGSEHWPLVADVDHDWYLKPDGAQLLCSPADETPSEPCDARPDEIDVARAIEAINTATTLGLRTVRSSWAGLRTFSPDDTMVIGPDPDRPRFVWCVGQGGTGIQTAPAAGRLTAALTLDGEPGADLAGLVDLPALLPDRFR